MIARRMTLVASLVTLLMTAVASVAQSSEVADKLKAIEVQTWELWKTKDKTGYADLFGEPAIRVTADGINSGIANTVALDTADNCNKRHYDLQTISAHKITDDVYVLTYRVLFGESCDGEAAKYNTYFTSTYRKDGDDWKNVAYTETAVE